MGKFTDDVEFIRQLALQRAQQHDAKAFANDVEYVKDIIKLKTKKPQDDPLCLPGGPETFQTASADKLPADTQEEKSDAECKYLYNSITESVTGILVGFELKCRHPYMARLPQMQEAAKTYESLVNVLIHLYSLRMEPDISGECAMRFDACKQVFEELKEAWEGLLYYDTIAVIDR